MQLEESELPKLFKHEQSIVHQYKTINSLKKSLTEKDAVIHIDFSENNTTKCNQKIKSIILAAPELNFFAYSGSLHKG